MLTNHFVLLLLDFYIYTLRKPTNSDKFVKSCDDFKTTVRGLLLSDNYNNHCFDYFEFKQLMQDTFLFMPLSYFKLYKGFMRILKSYECLNKAIFKYKNEFNIS